MGLLVDRNTPPVAVKFGNDPDDEQEVNTVFVKARFTLGDTIQIEEASLRLEVAQSDDSKDGEPQAFRVPVSTIGQMVAAMRHAVTGWEGPMFKDHRYRRSIWNDIDIAENEWWIRKVHKRIDELNTPRTDDPKPAKSPNAK